MVHLLLLNVSDMPLQAHKVLHFSASLLCLGILLTLNNLVLFTLCYFKALL